MTMNLNRLNHNIILFLFAVSTASSAENSAHNINSATVL